MEESPAFSAIVLLSFIAPLPQLAQAKREERLRERAGWFYSGYVKLRRGEELEPNKTTVKKSMGIFFDGKRTFCIFS